MNGSNVRMVMSGITAFHVTVSIQHETRDGFHGSRILPEFVVFGSDETHAESLARTIVGFKVGDDYPCANGGKHISKIENVVVTVMPVT